MAWCILLNVDVFIYLGTLYKEYVKDKLWIEAVLPVFLELVELFVLVCTVLFSFYFELCSFCMYSLDAGASLFFKKN